MMNFLRWAAVFLWFHLPLAQAVESRMLVASSGETVSLKLVDLDDDQFVFRDAMRRKDPYTVGDFVRWGSLAAPAIVEQVLLSDGSMLVGRLTAVTRQNAVVETDVWGELTIPRSLLGGIVWELPTGLADQWRLRDRLVSDDADDLDARLWLRNGDFVDGDLVRLERQKVYLQTPTGEVAIKQALVAAWRPAGKRGKQESAGTVFGLLDGTKLVAKEFRFKQRLELDLACGLHLGSLLEVHPIREGMVCYLRNMNANVRYLSDLPVLGHKHIPFLTKRWDWGKDRSVVGGPLSSKDHLYEKGIGLHSTARLAFDLPPGYDEFQAELCIDRSAGKQGSVRFRVFTSGDAGGWEEAWKSDTVRGGERLRAVRLPLAGATRLALIVDFADRGAQLDRANWIGARIVKRR